MGFYATYPSTAVSSGPVQFYKNGIPVYVSEDTVTPTNSNPLPTTILGPSGVPIDFAEGFGNPAQGLRTAAQIGNSTGAADFGAGATSAQTVRAVLPTDQTPIPASQSGTWNINNITGTVTLPTGAATAANQTTANTSLASIDSKLGSLGQKTMAGSAPVVIASDQSPVTVAVNNFPATQPVSGTVAISQATPGTTNGVQVVAALPAGANNIGSITNVTGAVSLPTGASTSALQTTGNTSLSSIDSKLADNYGVATAALRTAAQIGNATGAADFGSGTTSAQTVRVVLPTDQTAIATKDPVNANGSYAEITNLTTTAQTFTVPANAVGFIMESLSDNQFNIRWKIGAAATSTSGLRLEPGRDTGYIPCSANVSVCAETAGTSVINIQWVLSQ